MRKSKKLSTVDKRYAQREHFKKRMFERYGITVNRTLYRDMVNMVQRSDGIFLGQQSNRLKVWRLFVHDQHITIVYDSIRKELVTATPPEEPVVFRGESLERCQ